MKKRERKREEKSVAREMRPFVVSSREPGSTTRPRASRSFPHRFLDATRCTNGIEDIYLRVSRFFLCGDVVEIAAASPNARPRS